MARAAWEVLAQARKGRPPATATPTVWPTWRVAELTPAAAPACSRGIPATAVWVMGAPTAEFPRPMSAYATSSHTIGVVTETWVRITAAAVREIPAMSSGIPGAVL